MADKWNIKGGESSAAKKCLQANGLELADE
jgi:hypothetical protein